MMSFLRKLLKERSGLDLSPDKQYLVESRLVPLARRIGPPGITGARPENEGWISGGAPTADVVEAMTTNETFFFRADPFSTICATRRCCRRAQAVRALRNLVRGVVDRARGHSIAMCLKELGATLGRLGGLKLSQPICRKAS